MQHPLEDWFHLSILKNLDSYNRISHALCPNIRVQMDQDLMPRLYLTHRTVNITYATL